MFLFVYLPRSRAQQIGRLAGFGPADLGNRLADLGNGLALIKSFHAFETLGSAAGSDKNAASVGCRTASQCRVGGGGGWLLWHARVARCLLMLVVGASRL